MHRLSHVGILVAACVICFVLVSPAAAQTWPDYPNDSIDVHSIDRGPGGYLAWYKILLVVIVYFVWIRLADSVNRDAQLNEKKLGIRPELWNPLTLFCFLGGFLAVISIPFFAIGFPLCLFASVFPWFLYRSKRKRRMKEYIETKGTAEEDGPGPLIDERLPPIKINASASEDATAQTNLIRARQSGNFVELAELLYDSTLRRADGILMDFTPDKVVVQRRIDGHWHPLSTLDRTTGDAMLEALKTLAALNPRERRNKQKGSFETRVGRTGSVCELVTQGVPNGERAMIRISELKKAFADLGQLGMWPDDAERLQKLLNSPGYVLVSSRPGEGITTSWQIALESADRFTRDCVAMVSSGDHESELENIEQIKWGDGDAKSRLEPFHSTLLRQPEVVIVSRVNDKKILDALTTEVVKNKRTALSQVTASNASEALLRMYKIAGDRKQFAAAVTAVTAQRLVRRLCDDCKQETPENLELLAKIGGDPQDPRPIFTQWAPPPPEERVDERGKPIEIPVCESCGGVGFIGRIGVFEVLFIDDTIRAAMAKKPNVEAITKVAVKKSGHRTLVNQCYRMVLAGVTSLAEVQRVMQPPAARSSTQNQRQQSGSKPSTVAPPKAPMKKS